MIPQIHAAILRTDQNRDGYIQGFLGTGFKRGFVQPAFVFSIQIYGLLEIFTDDGRVLIGVRSERGES